MTEQAKAPEKRLPDDQQWQLALAYLQRAETSAHVLRAVLFFAAIAFAVVVLLQMQANERGLAFLVNVASVALSVAAIFCLVKSWQLQKEKALDRFKYLKAKDTDAVALYEGVTSQLQGLQSRFWDWLAFWALAGAILIQLAVRMIGAAGTLHV
jgi:amino acid transporter